MIDTHIHLNASQYHEDLDDVINRALSAGVQKMIIPNVDRDSISSMLDIQKIYPGIIYPMIGLHPCSVQLNYKDQLIWVEKEITESKYCAIGEIGIDLYWDKSLRAEQEAVFKAQIKMAHENDLAINIHSRDSIDLCIDIIEELDYDNLKGIFHCFTGTYEQAQRIIKLGFLLGIGGVITFKNSSLRDVIYHVDLKHIVLETDGPYLTPHPHRGKRNESSYLTLITEEIANTKGIPKEEVIKVTTTNAIKIYKLDNY